MLQFKDLETDDYKTKIDAEHAYLAKTNQLEHNKIIIRQNFEIVLALVKTKSELIIPSDDLIRSVQTAKNKSVRE